MSKASKLCALLLAGAVLPAYASDITLQGVRLPSAASFQPDANAYRDVLTGLANDPYFALPATLLAEWDNVSNLGVFGSNNHFGWIGTINFHVAPGRTGDWSFRAGVDFGYGGALFLDGVALDWKSHDIWWGGAYTNPAQYLSGNATLDAGSHTLQIFGLENCCDGYTQVQFRAAGASDFVTFVGNDNVSPVPEPSSLAMTGLGLAAVFALARRKARRG